MSNPNQKIAWQAPEFRHYEKSALWYITLSLLAVLLVAYFSLKQDYFAALTMAILGAMVAFFSRQKPEIMEIELTSKHIKFGDIALPYKNLKSFWLVYNQNHKTLNLETTTYINNLVILELGETDPEEVRNFLLNYLPEHPERESETFAQKLMHGLKF